VRIYQKNVDEDDDERDERPPGGVPVEQRVEAALAQHIACQCSSDVQFDVQCEHICFVLVVFFCFYTF